MGQVTFTIDGVDGDMASALTGEVSSNDGATDRKASAQPNLADVRREEDNQAASEAVSQGSQQASGAVAGGEEAVGEKGVDESNPSEAEYIAKASPPCCAA